MPTTDYQVIAQVLPSQQLAGGADMVPDLTRVLKLGGTIIGSSELHGIGINATLQPAVNQSGYGLVSEPTFQKAASGQHSVLASIWARKPVIVGAGAATIGTVATLYVQGGSTEGANNYALFVEQGIVRLGTTPTVDGVAVAITQAAPNQSLTVGVASNVVPSQPRGIFVSSSQNNSGEVAGIAFGFNGFQYSAAIAAIETDTAQQSADLSFSTRTSAGGGITAERWRITGGASAGHLLAQSDNTYDIGATGAQRPRNLFLGGGITIGATQLLASSVALANNAAAAAATLNNAPTAGNPTKWIPINDNGTIRNIPAW